MSRPIVAAAIAVVVLACGGQPVGTASPSPSGTPVADPSFVEERTAGITLKEGDAGTANLAGGRYRIGWYAPGCTMLGLQIATGNGDTIGIDVRLPSGESVLDLPAGVAVLNRVGDCDYTVRFEEAP